MNEVKQTDEGTTMKASAATSNAVSLRKDAAEAFVTEHPLWPVSGAMARDSRKAPPVHLTPRQLEVFSLLCEGLPNKLICRQLNIATGTVKVHISVILRELGVSSRLQAVVAAQRCGLLGEFVVTTSEQAVDSAPAGQLTIAAGTPDYGTSRQLAVAG